MVVDASLVLRLLIDEPGSAQAQALWQGWRGQRAVVAAPTLLVYETVNGLHQAWRRDILGAEALQEALEVFAGFPVRYHGPRRLANRAWTLARELGLEATYDTFYLALAEVLKAEFWTGDRRLYTRVRGRVPAVRALGETSS